MKRLRFLFALALVIALGSCIDEPECTYDTLRDVKFAFIQSEFLYADTLLVDSVVIVGSDSAYSRGVTSFHLTLPINASLDSTTYFFDLKNDEIDFNIVLGYDRRPRLISEECGVEIEIINLNVLSHDVDSVVINNHKFLPDVETNVKVYR